MAGMPHSRNDRIHFDERRGAGPRVGASSDSIQRCAAGIGYLSGVIEPNGFPEIDPLDGHPGHVSAQGLLREQIMRSRRLMRDIRILGP